MINKLLFLLVFVATHALAYEEISGKVITVIDGNTVEVDAGEDGTYKILLHGIDSPELGQNYGDKAKAYLEKLLLDKSVSVQIQGKDRWGTRMGIVVVEGTNDPRVKLLEEGLAWTSEKNPIGELESVKEKAKTEGKGLWKDENPVPPWTFRRQQTMLVPKSS